MHVHDRQPQIVREKKGWGVKTKKTKERSGETNWGVQQREIDRQRQKEAEREREKDR